MDAPEETKHLTTEEQLEAFISGLSDSIRSAWKKQREQQQQPETENRHKRRNQQRLAVESISLNCPKAPRN